MQSERDARTSMRGAASLAVLYASVAWARPTVAETLTGPGEVLVLAAASLRDVLGPLARDFEAAHPRNQVRLSFAGSQELRAQIERGATADLFVSADLAHMERLQGRGLVEPPVLVARNRPVLVVSPAVAVRSFADLPMIRRLVVGAAEVPIGSYTLEILRAAGQRFGADFRAAVEAHIVSRELNVKHVLARIVMGDADGGIVYASDAAAVPDKVRSIEVPAALNVIAPYPAALIRGAKRPDLARAFLALLRSKAGQERLRAAGFMPAAEEPAP